MNIFDKIKKLAWESERYKLYIDYNRPRIVVLSRLYREGILPEEYIDKIEDDSSDPIDIFNSIFIDLDYILYKSLFTDNIGSIEEISVESITESDNLTTESDNIIEDEESTYELENSDRFEIENIDNENFINIYDRDGTLLATYEAYITEIGDDVDDHLLSSLKAIKGPDGKYYTLGELNSLYKGFEYDRSNLAKTIVDRFISTYYS